jgi:hypothetical protein
MFLPGLQFLNIILYEFVCLMQQWFPTLWLYIHLYTVYIVDDLSSTTISQYTGQLDNEVDHSRSQIQMEFYFP